MKLSTKGRYAVMAMVDLARHAQSKPVSLSDIATRQDIPQRYLEQVLLGLTRAGLLVSRRGSAGGYRLARAAEQVTVGDVLRAVEGSMNGLEPTRRGRRGLAPDPVSDLSELWREIDEAVSGVIDRVTFEDLRKRAEERRSIARPMYHI